jgi:outer membrane protein insertion porin family
MGKSWKVVWGPHFAKRLQNGRPFILIVLLSLGLAFSDANGVEEVISSIETAGNRSVSRARVLAEARSRVGEVFDPDTASEDAKRIAELSGVEYAYYNTVVVDEKIRLTFVVVERNVIRAINFVGNRKYKSKKLRKKLDFRVGDFFDVIEAEGAVNTLVEFYHEKGFAFVRVSLDEENGRLTYTIVEGPRVKIESVKFSGNKKLKTKKLKSGVKTKKRKFIFWRKYYVEETLAKDVAKLQNVYYERGFLDAGVKAEREFDEDKSKVRVTFAINEGPVYTVGRVTIVGNEYLDESKLRTELKLEHGQVYSERKASSGAKRLLKLYRESGFIDSQVKDSATFISENTVNVEFEVAEGERSKIGRIDITGNEETQDKVVRRILDEYDFSPGNWYNADIARGDGSGYLEKLIRRTAYTGAATITPVGEKPGWRDAQVSVTEGQTGMVMLGAGVASDSGVIGQLVFEQRNFDISDKPESFYEFITGNAFKGAGQNLRVSMMPGTEVSEYSVSFTEPYLQNKPVSLDVVGSSWERWRESHDEQRMKAYVGLEKRYKNRWRRSIGFRAENVDVTDLDNDAPQEIIDVSGENTLLGVRFGVSRDLTDDRFNPSRGYNFNASYEQVGGDHTFGILRGIHRRYKTLYEDLAERKTILATKLLAAMVIGDAPPFEKFYAGGSGTYGMRGFDYRGISPRGLQRGVARPERKDPIGSDWVFLANAEVTVPLVSNEFAALFFVDSGAVDEGGYRIGAGVGIQILLPQWFGPVPMRFELAVPLMRDGDDDTQVFSFSVGRLF